MKTCLRITFPDHSLDFIWIQLGKQFLPASNNRVVVVVFLVVHCCDKALGSGQKGLISYFLRNT